MLEDSKFYATRYGHYKQLVDQLIESGGLDANRQQPISQAIIDFLLARKKDPITMLNIYCTVSGEPHFQFFNFEVAGRGKNKFLFITELDGKPVYGICAQTKKEAKKACALRLLDILMAQNRLDCINENGRKIKRPPPKPLPSLQSVVGIDESANGAEAGQDADMSFSDDIDIDGIKREFEKINPVPDDCKNVQTFTELRSTAFKLHCANAFWGEVNLSEQTVAKLEKYKMKNNSISFVNRCIALMEQHSGEEGGSAEGNIVQQKQQVEYFLFTLPYVPRQYVCLTHFGGQVHHGMMANSKQKAKMNCAQVLAEFLVQRGLADIKRRRNKSSSKLPSKKRKLMDEQQSDLVLAPHQYLLTLHPHETLDPKTHFLLATYGTDPVQLLNKIAIQRQFAVSFVENKDDAGKFVARVDSINGAGWGSPEENEEEAKRSAARVALDVLVKDGHLSISQDGFNHFRTVLGQFCARMA